MENTTTLTNRAGEPLTVEAVAYILEIPKDVAHKMLSGPELYDALEASIDHVGTVIVGRGSDAAAAKATAIAAIDRATR